MKSYQSSSTVRPEEWDKTSSPGRVYHNYNVIEAPADGENPLMYHYDVDEYSRMEYLELQDSKLAALEADSRLLLETAGEQEYRLCLMELGVSDSDL